MWSGSGGLGCQRGGGGGSAGPGNGGRALRQALRGRTVLEAAAPGTATRGLAGGPRAGLWQTRVPSLSNAAPSLHRGFSFPHTARETLWRKPTLHCPPPTPSGPWRRSGPAACPGSAAGCEASRPTGPACSPSRQPPRVSWGPACRVLTSARRPSAALSSLVPAGGKLLQLAALARGCGGQ